MRRRDRARSPRSASPSSATTDLPREPASLSTTAGRQEGHPGAEFCPRPGDLLTAPITPAVPGLLPGGLPAEEQGLDRSRCACAGLNSTVAADLLLTGRHITAAQALAIGLIGHVVPDGQALSKALEIAEMIAANGPVAVRAILRTIRETEGLPEADAFKIEAQVGMTVFRSEDAKEGPHAFTEKRKPQFRDR